MPDRGRSWRSPIGSHGVGASGVPGQTIGKGLLVVGDAVCLDLDDGPAMVATEGALDSAENLVAILRGYDDDCAKSRGSGVVVDAAVVRPPARPIVLVFPA